MLRGGIFRGTIRALRRIARPLVNRAAAWVDQDADSADERPDSTAPEHWLARVRESRPPEHWLKLIRERAGDNPQTFDISLPLEPDRPPAAGNAPAPAEAAPRAAEPEAPLYPPTPEQPAAPPRFSWRVERERPRIRRDPAERPVDEPARATAGDPRAAEPPNDAPVRQPAAAPRSWRAQRVERERPQRSKRQIKRRPGAPPSFGTPPALFPLVAQPPAQPPAPPSAPPPKTPPQVKQNRQHNQRSAPLDAPALHDAARPTDRDGERVSEGRDQPPSRTEAGFEFEDRPVNTPISEPHYRDLQTFDPAEIAYDQAVEGWASLLEDEDDPQYQWEQYRRVQADIDRLNAEQETRRNQWSGRLF